MNTNIQKTSTRDRLISVTLALLLILSFAAVPCVHAAGANEFVSHDFNDTTKFTAGTSVTAGSSNPNALAPYYMAAASDNFQSMSISGDAVNGNSLQLYAFGSSTRKYAIASFDNATASALPAGMTTHTGMLETTFSFIGTNESIFELGGVIVIRKDSGANTWGIYARTSGDVGGNSDGTYTGMERLCEFPTPAVSERTKKYSLQAVLAVSVSGATISRTLSNVFLDGTEVWSGTKDLSPATQGVFFNPGGTLAGRNKVFAVNTNTSTGGNTTYLNIYTVKYSLFRGVKEIAPDDEYLFDGSKDAITIRFADAPKAGSGTTVGEELRSQITLSKVGGDEVRWVSEDGYDADAKEIVIKSDAMLELNTQYKVTVAAREYTITGMADAPTEKTFTTGWEGLTVSDVPSAVTSGSFAPGMTVENTGLASGSFTTITALYRVNGSVLNMIDTSDPTTHTVSPNSTASITAGGVEVPEDDGNYFVKVFFLAADEPVARPAVIGTPVTAAAENADGTASVVALTGTADNGRIDGTGKHIGLKDRGLWITVEDPEGTPVYYDQTTGNETNDFAFGFNLLAGSDSGTYTCKVKPAGESVFTDTIAMDFSVVKPVVSDLKIKGDAVCGQTIEADYLWFDFAGRADNSVVTWHIADAQSGPFGDAVATGKTLTLPDSYLGKYIICKVLPKTDSGVEGEDLVTVTDALHIVTAPVAANARLSQASGKNRVDLLYDYSNLSGYEEYQSTYKWFIAPAAGGTYTEVTNDQTFYRVTASDNGKYMKAEVTVGALLPEGSDAKQYGVPVTTAPIQMTYTASSVSGTVSQGGGNGGGGGSFSGAVIDNSPPVHQPPEEETKAGTLDFTDVRGHWAEKEIFKLYDQGIVTGRSEYIFDPDSQITRAEFIAILARAMKLKTVSYNGSFGDVSASDWYADVIQTAHANGLFDGAQGYANPNQNITREQMAAIVVRAYEKALGEIALHDDLLDFGDAADISQWARVAVCKARIISLLSGTPEGNVMPLADATRAEGAVIISRLMELIGTTGIEAEQQEPAAEDKELSAIEQAAADAVAEDQALQDAMQKTMLEDAQALEEANQEEYYIEN